MSILKLDQYGMSAERGFLCRDNASAVTLTGDFAQARDVAMHLADYLPTGRCRHILGRDVPDNITSEHIAALSDPQARMAMLHYAFMVQAYVWGEAETPTHLPKNLAVPIVALADRLGQQPILTYNEYVLHNWDLIDPNLPIGLDNIYMIQKFLAGQDEAWFVLIHVAIEARAGEIFAAMIEIIAALKKADAQAVQLHLETMATVWADINALFDRMPERCDPYIYFERVRPYIHGWKDNPALPNGLIYEGVERYKGQGQTFRGQTGSQSSIVPSMDALLNIGHAADPLKAYLDQLHIYRPPGHRQFIDDIRHHSRLRAFTQKTGDAGLTKAYNANVQAVADFRSRHLEYAASYINKQGKKTSGNDPEVGTGGTPFMRYLKKHRDETRANLLRA